MKKVFNLSIFVFLLAIIVSAPSVYAKSENSGSGKGSFEFGLSGGVKVEDDSSSSDDNSNSDDSSSSSSSSSSALEVEADIFTNETIVKVEINDRKSIFSTSAKTRDEIVAEVVSKYPTLTKAEVEAVLNLETENRSSRPGEKSEERNDRKDDDSRNNSGNDNSIGAKIKASFFGNSDKNDDSKKENSFMRKMSAEFVFKRFEEAVKHIEKFILRLDAAVLQFKTAGSDTAIAEGFLTSAKTDLSEAQTHWQNAKNAYDGGAVGAKEMIKEHLDLMKTEIRSSFENLKATIGALKDLRVDSDDDSDDSDDADEDNSGTN